MIKQRGLNLVAQGQCRSRDGLGPWHVGHNGLLFHLEGIYLQMQALPRLSMGQPHRAPSSRLAEK
jgi:hypothetical protein